MWSCFSQFRVKITFGLLVLLASTVTAAEIKIEGAKLKEVELTYTAPKAADDPDPTSGTIQKTIEVIEKPTNKAEPKAPPVPVESVRTRTTSTLPIIPAKPQPAESGTTTGQLTYETEPDQDFDFGGDRTFDFWVAPPLADGLRIQLGDSKAPREAFVIITDDPKTPGLRKVAVSRVPDPKGSDKQHKKDKDLPKKFPVRITIPLVKDTAAVHIGPTSPAGSEHQTVEVSVSNRTADAWAGVAKLTVKNGKDVVYSGPAPEVAVGATVTLQQQKSKPVTPAVSLKQVILTFSPPAAASAPSTPQSPPVSPAGTLAVGTQQTTTETFEEPKGNVRSIKTTTTAVALTEAPKPPSPSKSGTTAALLIYEGEFGRANQPTVQIDPMATQDEDVIVDLTDTDGNAIGWTLDSDRIPDSKVTKKNPQLNVVTLKVIPEGKVSGRLKIRIQVPVGGNTATAEIAYTARMEEQSRLINRIKVTNGTSVDWANASRLTVKTGDQVVYDNREFAALSAGGFRTVSQKLSTLVDAKTIYVDLSTLLDGDKAKPDNVARLPRSMKLDNGKSCPDGECFPLPAGTSIQLGWHAPHVPLVKLPDSVSLKAALPLGTNCPAGETCEQCCGPVGVCAVGGPKEKSPFITFLNIGEDPRIGVISASRAKSAPFIPLSISDGELTYVTAERWKFQVCLEGDCDASNVRFIDTRTGVTAFGSPPQLKPKANSSPQQFYTQYEPRSVSTAVVKLTVLDDLDDIVDLLNALAPNLNDVFNNLPPDIPSTYNDELAPLFCLNAASKKTIDTPTGDPQTTKAYLQCLVGQLAAPFQIAKDYKSRKSDLAKNQQSQKVLDLELQRLTIPSAGDRFGVAALKLRLELERLRANEDQLKLDIQRLGSELIDAVSQARSCNS